MYSVYFNGGQVRASSRRSSCLRPSNRSIRKSFPSQVNRSNAKKHGGFPRRNIRFLNCGLPRLSSEQISPSITALAYGRQSEIDSANMLRLRRTSSLGAEGPESAGRRAEDQRLDLS